MSTERRAAAFLDRDGTLIVDAHYPNDPDAVRLIPGAAAAVAELNAAKVPVIVVTNQSGIAQKRVTLAQYEAVRARVSELMAAEGARIDASYFCPHHPEFTGPCECRKPGTLLYRQAAEAFSLDVSASLFAGDRWRDIAPALSLGGTGVLVPSASTPDADRERALSTEGVRIAASLREAIEPWLAKVRA